MRNFLEIRDRVKFMKNEDIFGWSIMDLISRLPFKLAKEFLNDDAKEHEWDRAIADPDRVKEELIEYLPFAWDKAINHRGLSAQRSIHHIRNWLWLMEDEETLAFVEDGYNYAQYGVPILKHVSDKYGYEYRTDREELNEAIERMAKGNPCGLRDDCGCGK